MMCDKVGAVYALRAAAEKHGRVEAIVGDAPQGTERNLLLDTRMHLEELTQAAIEACEHCGLPHVGEDPPLRALARPSDQRRLRRRIGRKRPRKRDLTGQRAGVPVFVLAFRVHALLQADDAAVALIGHMVDEGPAYYGVRKYTPVSSCRLQRPQRCANCMRRLELSLH
jgi:hypothetical protein